MQIVYNCIIDFAQDYTRLIPLRLKALQLAGLQVC